MLDFLGQWAMVRSWKNGAWFIEYIFTVSMALYCTKESIWLQDVLFPCSNDKNRNFFLWMKNYISLCHCLFCPSPLVVVTSAVWPALVMYHSLPGLQWSPWWWSGQAVVMMEQTTHAGTVSQTVSACIIQMLWKFILLMHKKIRSSHNFAHAMAADMARAKLWPDTIIRNIIKAKQIFPTFTLWAHKRVWNMSLISSSQQNRSRTHGLIELMLFDSVIS